MANEPTLGELTHIPSDPNLGGGVPVPVIDNSRMVEELNQNARFRAQQTWQKYQQFLQNKSDLFKNISDIQSLDTLPEDKPELQKQAAGILSDILKNPSAVMGGKGYNEIQAKIAQFKGNAMLSKQNNLDTTADKLFLERNPELQTEDNMGALSKYRQTPLGQRKTVQLQLPTVFDEKSAFDDLLKSTTQPYAQTVGADGKAGEGYIETGNEVNPQALIKGWGLALQGQKDKYGHSILKAVTDNFNALPPEEKQKYQQGGGDPVQKYFLDRGQKYLDAYFPKGSYETTPQGTYRFGKKLTADPNYRADEKLALDREKLIEKTNYDNAHLKVLWSDIGLKRDKINKENTEDLGDASNVIDEASSIINNGSPVKVWHPNGVTNELRVSDPTLLQKFGNIDKDGNVTNVPTAMNFNPNTGQVTLIYGEYNNTKGSFLTDTGNGSISHTKDVPLDQRTWLKIIAARSFPNKNIGTVNNLVNEALKANGNSIFEISKKLKGGQTSSPENTPTPAPAKAQPNNPVKLSGHVDPKQLRQGQVYSVNGKLYIWDGKKLKVQ